MFQALFQWDTAQKILLNTVFVSIPEELYIVMFTLILMGEFDYWKDEHCTKLFDRWDYVRVFVPVIGSALISNILRYTGADDGIITLGTLLSIFVLMLVTGDLWGDAKVFKWIGKAFIYLLLATISVAVFELMYMPFIIYGMGTTLKEINNNIFNNFLIIIPARICMYSILALFFARKRTLLKANIFKVIFENKTLTILSLFILISNFAFMMLMYKTIVYEKILVDLSFELRIIEILTVCSVPTLNIILFLLGVYYIKNKETEKQKNIAEIISNLSNEVKLYTNSEEYDNIKWKLNGLGNQLDDLTQILYLYDKSNTRR